MDTKNETINKTINVLLIEDNPADARLITEYLNENKDYNFKITYADSLERALQIGQALQLIKEKKIDIDDIAVIILDLGLPDCNGLETFRRVWAGQVEMMPIIILTGSALSRHDLRRCVEESYDFLQKGFIDSKILTDAVLGAIEKCHAKKRIMFLNEVRSRKIKTGEEVVKNEVKHENDSINSNFQERRVDKKLGKAG